MKIDYKNDVTRASEEAEGSDGRVNVSARSDSRGYYNSRDKKQTYSIAWDMQDASAGEHVMYLKNTSATKQIVITGVGFNAEQNAKVKLNVVTGTAADGNELTPVNMNLGSSNAADCAAREGGSAATGITGLTDAGLIDLAYVPANGHEEFRIADRLRLVQNTAIAIEYDEGTTGDCSGVMFFFFE
tara:strand:+ start:4376 stop:4933 length:558 start_codon:yes stop_codon:yes gene_type:complete